MYISDSCDDDDGDDLGRKTGQVTCPLFFSYLVAASMGTWGCIQGYDDDEDIDVGVLVVVIMMMMMMMMMMMVVMMMMLMI